MARGTSVGASEDGRTREESGTEGISEHHVLSESEALVGERESAFLIVCPCVICI